MFESWIMAFSDTLKFPGMYSCLALYTEIKLTLMFNLCMFVCLLTTLHPPSYTTVLNLLNGTNVLRLLNAGPVSATVLHSVQVSRVGNP